MKLALPREHKESWIVQEYSAFHELIKGRAAPHSFEVGADIAAETQELWGRLISDDYRDNLQGIIFDDIYGGDLIFRRKEGGIMFTQLTRISLWNRIRFTVLAYWHDYIWDKIVGK